VTRQEARDRKALIFTNSFMCFFSGNETLQQSRSLRNPTYLTENAKSWPFFSMGCHRTPRGAVIWNVLRSKLNEGKAPHEEETGT